MPRVLALVALASVLALVGQLAPPLARVGHACLCGDYPPAAQALQEADAVFAGRVYAVEGGLVWAPFLDRLRGEPPLRRTEPVRARFTVIEAWKGTTGHEVEIRTGIGSGDCGYPVEVRQAYLIYARSYQGGPLSTSICSNSRPLWQTPADWAALGEGTRPTLSPPLSVVAVESSLRAVLPHPLLLELFAGLVAAVVLIRASVSTLRAVRSRRQN